MRTHQWTALAGAMMLAFVLAEASEAGIERDVVGGKETIECGGQNASVIFSATGGHDYLIMVSGKNGQAGMVRIRAALQPR